MKSFYFFTLIIPIYFAIDAAPKKEPPLGLCQKEIGTFCQDRNILNQLMECLKKDESRLSSSCKHQLGSLIEEFKTKMESCKDDRAKFCRWVVPGGGRIIKCLKDRETEISTFCKETLKELYKPLN
ncbi:cysteine rich repeat domain protein [Leptospira broomii serovar Hurstbridge str. 5399]|uniref:Cysteine rich repeat domain protein n=1 Tax=Leptospira broomii serovar Hurstbridge str. 5399 TaxID=1049789 RepID=T0EWG5_9LEPT|nr:cysteine rich repeat-containing protein [Leptospira broomii]EQA43200.1 cysteine rich repeat domain protein [Leptospira broomii serovar Hurstbridge str. 5399]